MTRLIWTGLLVAATLTLAACGTPESSCRDGVAKLKQRMVGLLGTEQRTDSDVVQAQSSVDMAEAQLATGNYEGCNISLEQAGASLNRSQRTNQQ